MTYSFYHSFTPQQRILGAMAFCTLVVVFMPSIFGGLFSGIKSIFKKLSLRWSFFKKQQSIFIAGIEIKDDARLRHTHIVGATGAGKTVLIENLLYQDLSRGYGALIIDPKGDREFYDRIKSFCRSIGRESDLHLLSSTHVEESCVWNPCRLGGVSELQSKFFNSSVYDHAYFAKAVELALLKAFQSLDEKHPLGFTLVELGHVLEGMANQSKDETLKGLCFDFQSLALSEWGRVLGCEFSKQQTEISLLDVTRKNEILFVDLPTEAKKIQSQRIGKLLLSEIMLLSGMRKTFPHIRGERPFSIYVDEFDAFATESFATFLNKGRSSAFMIHLAHQTLSDLNQVSETFAGQIMGNTNVRFVFRQDDPDDAEKWARFFGTKTVLKSTYQTKDGLETGMSSNRAAQEFRISPDIIKDLSTGQCVASIKTEKVFQKVTIPFDSNLKLWPKLPMQRRSLNEVVKKPTSLKKQDVDLGKSIKNPKPKMEDLLI